MNNFEAMWKDQGNFNDKVTKDFDMIKDEKWCMNSFYTLAMVRETSEFLNETNWKIHRKENKSEIKSNMLEEYVDIFKYWMCLGQLHGFKPEEVIEEYYRKSQVVEQRYQQEMKLQLNGRKVVGVDIDGILADYPRSFVDFVNREMGTNVPLENIKSYDIFKDMGLTVEQGRALKHRYREEGMKRYIPLCEGAKEFLEALRRAGYVIAIVTSRPYQEYRRIFADTQYWLAVNELPYDVILWAENKGEKLVQEFGRENIAFCIDDVADYANNVSKMGIDCYLKNTPYNANSKLGGNVIRVDKLSDIFIPGGES